jgi:CBS domain containing-hemolysin-like protein
MSHVYTTALLLGAPALVFLNGCFVAAEFALVRIRKTRLEELAYHGNTQARVALTCLNDLSSTLSALQLGTTLASLSLGWIGEEAFSDLLQKLAPQYFAGAAVGRNILASTLSFFMVTLLHVVLGELVPKGLAIQRAEQITLAMAKPMRVFCIISRPFIGLFTQLAASVLSLLGIKMQDETPLSEHELKQVMKDSQEDGVITSVEAQIISRAFEFADKRAKDIMVPREEVNFLSLDRPIHQNLELGVRMAIVRDGAGRNTGLVTVEKVLEQLVGDTSTRSRKGAS